MIRVTRPVSSSPLRKKRHTQFVPLNHYLLPLLKQVERFDRGMALLNILSARQSLEAVSNSIPNPGQGTHIFSFNESQRLCVVSSFDWEPGVFLHQNVALL
jgi:hypothetical protein